jgi:hypothetical protein
MTPISPLAPLTADINGFPTTLLRPLLNALLRSRRRNLLRRADPEASVQIPLRINAFAAALGRARVLAAAGLPALSIRQSGAEFGPDSTAT